MDWTIIQQALPAYGHGFVLTVWLSLVGIIGSIIVGVIASLLQYFKTPILSRIGTQYTAFNSTFLFVLCISSNWLANVINYCRNYRFDFPGGRLHG